MQTIIAATDFTGSADNAAFYAAELAVRMKSKLVLFHSYIVPVPPVDVPVYPISPVEIRSGCIEKLNALKGKIKKTHPEAEVEIFASPGNATAELLAFAEKTKAGMLVLGLRKRAGKWGELLGSVATSVMRKANREVLIVPEGVRFAEPSSILFAYDYNSPLPDEISEKLKS